MDCFVCPELNFGLRHTSYIPMAPKHFILPSNVSWWANGESYLCLLWMLFRLPYVISRVLLWQCLSRCQATQHCRCSFYTKSSKLPWHKTCTRDKDLWSAFCHCSWIFCMLDSTYCHVFLIFGFQVSIPSSAHSIYPIFSTFSAWINPTIYGVINRAMWKEFRNILFCRKED